MWLICKYKLIGIHVINFEAHLHMFIYKTLFFLQQSYLRRLGGLQAIHEIYPKKLCYEIFGC